MARPVPVLLLAAVAAFALTVSNRFAGMLVTLPPLRSVGAHALSLTYLALLLAALIALARAASHLKASTGFLLLTGLACAAPMVVVLTLQQLAPPGPGGPVVPLWLEISANNLFGPVGAVLVGAAIGRIVNHPNTLIAAAGFAAFFDMVVVFLGPVAKLMESNSPLIQAVSVGAGSAVAPATGGFGRAIRVLSAVTIGPADVLFLAIFLSSVALLWRRHEFRLPTERATIAWMFGLLMLALVLVEFGVRAVPALAPMGLAVIAANIRHCDFTPREKRDLLIGGAFAAFCALLIVLVAPRIAARNRPRAPQGPIYGFITSRIPPAGELVVNGIAPESPAMDSGLKPGDVIEAIDGVRTPDYSEEALRNRVRDPARRVLAVRVRRLGEKRPLDLKIDGR